MKQSLSLVTSAFLLMGASNLFAASSIDLSVVGVLTPSACTPALSGGGMVDHGKISMSDLSYDAYLPLATLALSVNCEASTLMAVKSTDNRSGSAWYEYDTESAFGLGFHGENWRLGGYRLLVKNVQVDGAPAPSIESVDGKLWFPATEDQAWQPRWMRSVGAVGEADAIPVPVQNLAMDLTIQTRVRKPRGAITEEVPLDGSATLDIVYL
ncbi:DUF1120 domain-containing protein [Pseudomonas sp. MAFF 301514]|uniref:DUF1120 domain-containing protein n=2 Tax=Pseudomonas allii TaxID=2740531 RepID=A0A7Y8RJ89_9PSED|nr:hypothetical protein AO066_18745 [Pseudomonas fluorescens]NWN47263.1 DUF1120 domain-containing protein [Pseudomonas allii]NWN60046.1 DUF1120 domain-containing protein [Pseudomonas allii]